MAENYGVASMTAQRALHELRHLGLTYAVVRKGTFVHPLAIERIGTDV
jgi:DNA-binding GntR family transcriptional regulator